MGKRWRDAKRKSYGFHTFHVTEIALYHTLGKLWNLMSPTDSFDECCRFSDALRESLREYEIVVVACAIECDSARVAKIPNTSRPVELVVSIAARQHLESDPFRL